MPMTDRDIAAKAFATPEWAASADGIFQATGATVAVMDFERCSTLAAEHQCSYCHVATEGGSMSPVSCFDVCPPADASQGRLVCRAGLPVLYAPVERAGRVVTHVVIGGFVTSTRERRGRYESLLARGVSEDTARRVVKSLPVLARRQVEAFLQMAVAGARTVFEATADRVAAAERIEELRLFVSAGHHVVSQTRLDSGALGDITEEAVALIGGDAGALLRPRGNALEVVARTAGWRSALGATVPRASTASGRAADTRRTVVAPGKSGNATLAMPLVLSERVLAVLEVRLPETAVPVPQDRVARLSRFGQFIAIAVEREDERIAVERAMAGYQQLNGLAAALGGQTDTTSVVQLLVGVLDKAFTYNVAGLVLTGWGEDRYDIVVSGDLSKADVDELLSEVSGRDVEAEPFASSRIVTTSGSLTDEPRGHEEWAMAVTSLRHGDLDVGYLFVGRLDGEHYGAQDNALLEGIAAHGGPAFARAALFSRIRDDYAKTIAALSATLDLGEKAGAGHAGRVMHYAMEIGIELGLGHEEVEHLRFAGLLHDVGKTGVPQEILLKPSRLTPEEFELAKKHAEIGASIVDQIEFLKALTPIILHHHERWDGKGYPEGLKGEAIPLLARILAVADSFDAMTSARTYASKLTLGQAKDELESAAGTQFDPRVIAAFFDVLDRMALAGGTGLLAPSEVFNTPELPA